MEAAGLKTSQIVEGLFRDSVEKIRHKPADSPDSHKAVQFIRDGAAIDLGDSLKAYKRWAPPAVIISDGPYGLGSYKGDPPTPDNLSDFYAPHLSEWSRRARPYTTLWFWNSELGWANVHHLIQENGWEFRNCHIWNKGVGHVAGNSNTGTLRKFPVITEVCVQYVRKVRLPVNGASLSIKDWLRHEWRRTGLPFCRTNEACGVKNAATRKYFTKCHLWYFPPPDAFEMLQKYANQYGRPDGKPYFSIDGDKPLAKEEWKNMRAKFYCKAGITNVWSEPAVRGGERLKNKGKYLHMNQKPLSLLEMMIKASSDKDDVVWEPFGGLCSAVIAAHKLGRRAFAAEINRDLL
jgi:DNA modification methylase